jgi:hypothetical protein
MAEVLAPDIYRAHSFKQGKSFVKFIQHGGDGVTCTTIIRSILFPGITREQQTSAEKWCHVILHNHASVKHNNKLVTECRQLGLYSSQNV